MSVAGKRGASECQSIIEQPAHLLDITGRALPRVSVRHHLDAQPQARGIAVMLCGMVAPPNYGADFVARFNSIYPDLAKSYDVPLYPFFLEGVAAHAKLNQADGLHPTAEGVDIIVKNILPTVEAFLGTISRQPS